LIVVDMDCAVVKLVAVSLQDQAHVKRIYVYVLKLASSNKVD
jgi:hypothetical protein